jgi:hypothetical protein
LSYEEERRRIREEMIDEQVFAKEQQVLGNMRLSELLGVDPSKAIAEPPGEAGSADAAIPGVEGGGDMGGGGAPPGGGMGGGEEPPM